MLKQFYFKQLSLAKGQYQYQKQLYFQQFSLAKVCILNVKTVIFQSFQFSINTQFISVLPIDRTLSGSTTPGQRSLGAMAMKGYSAFPKAPALPDLTMRLFSVTSRTLVEESSPSA